VLGDELDINRLTKEPVLLSDWFEIPDKQKSHYTNENNENCKYPLIGAAKTNNGIVGYLDTYDYEKCFTIVKDGDGACGCVFYHNYKFNKVPTVYIMKLKRKMDYIDINCKLLTLQLHSIHDHSNKLDKNKLNNYKLYLYI